MREGIIIIDKPKDMTSFDVIAILRKKLGIKRIGHLGTLDPMATGLLAVAIGSSGRIMEYLDGDVKTYVAGIRLGIKTDTDDIWGEVIESRECRFPEVSLIEKALDAFRGVIEQTPPIYSALKVSGKKLYEYARAGEDVEIKSRKIYIPEIELLEVRPEEMELLIKVSCSKGTYIRSLARDLGDALGTLGTMSSLVRTKVGIMGLDDAITIEEVKSMEVSEIEKRIIPCDGLLMDFPETHLGDWESKLFCNGVKLRLDQWGGDADRKSLDFPLELPDIYTRLVRVYEMEGDFLGMGTVDENEELKAHKVLADIR